TYTTTKSGNSFVVVLFDEKRGDLLAVLEADALGQIRTGAASGLATDLLAKADAKIGAIIGTGFQAETQLLAIDAVRSFDEIRIYSRSAENRSQFVKKMTGSVRAKLHAVDSAQEAVKDADVICTITSAKEPVVLRPWIRKGAHINAAGGNWAIKRELDPEIVRDCQLICVDHREQSKIESGDLIGVVNNWDSVWELADVVKGKVRRNPSDITLFKSNGIAVEDIAAANFVYRASNK
ncbi:MAG: ornithine cyclodeaminase, partial [Acidobacteria bacterium]